MAGSVFCDYGGHSSGTDWVFFGLWIVDGAGRAEGWKGGLLLGLVEGGMEGVDEGGDVIFITLLGRQLYVL